MMSFGKRKQAGNKADTLANLKAAERQAREELRASVEHLIATFAPGQEDKVRKAFQPVLARIAAADAKDDAVAAEVLADVDVVRPVSQ